MHRLSALGVAIALSACPPPPPKNPADPDIGPPARMQAIPGLPTVAAAVRARDGYVIMFDPVEFSRMPSSARWFITLHEQAHIILGHTDRTSALLGIPQYRREMERDADCKAAQNLVKRQGADALVEAAEWLSTFPAGWIVTPYYDNPIQRTSTLLQCGAIAEAQIASVLEREKSGGKTSVSSGDPGDAKVCRTIREWLDVARKDFAPFREAAQDKTATRIEVTDECTLNGKGRGSSLSCAVRMSSEDVEKYNQAVQRCLGDAWTAEPYSRGDLQSTTYRSAGINEHIQLKRIGTKVYWVIVE